ncbi:MAG: VWA domain-containing protein [Ruminococcus sp.]|jgi:hypothetical protein|nr:VWA domain-containing protein [Ruminococcus sp.]
MITQFKRAKRFTSILICVTMLMSCCTLFANSVAAEETDVTRISDYSTMNEWKNYFGYDIKSTENEGSVWTDKTVLTDSSALGNSGISMNSNDDFLVALSAIASNKSVKVYSNMPTDTMLILDVSGSMNDDEGHNDLAEEMVDAANDSIADLLSSNKYNRIGVVLYSGASSGASTDDAVLVLPLDRYTTSSDGKYLSYTVTTSGGRHPSTTETVSIDSDVKIEKTGEKPKSVSKEVVGATYIQKGVILAMKQFTAESNTTTVDDPELGTLQRKPVMVLMSDGAPTLGSTDFTKPNQHNIGTGSSTNTALGFVSQLSSAYAKHQITEKYNSDCLFYTLGLGVGSDSVAVSVLNPSNSSDEINSLWENYNSANTGENITVPNISEGDSPYSVTKILQTLEQNYVDGFFKVDASSKDKAADLKKAFAGIVGAIKLQSHYFPTYVTDSENTSGYVTFTDQIGEYMEVTDMKGLLLNNTLYSGAELARNFSISDELASAVQSQLGLSDIGAAKSLISSACEHNQISYSSETEFSNYIGWYANAKGEYLGFWYDGIDTSLYDETQPAYIIKSYLYCGKVGEEQGVSSSDLRYAIVQVKESIANGEQTVTFAVPAALLPVVSYNVTLDKNDNISDLVISGAKEPVRLVYGVGLKEEINEQTIRDIVSEDYLAKNTNADGSVNFYTNKFEADNSTGFDKVNTISDFIPSKQNPKFYCLEDSPVYSDDKGTLLKGNMDSDAEYYCACTVYEIKDGSAQAKTAYKALSKHALKSAKQKDDGTWYIPSGSTNVNSDNVTEKEENRTETLKYSNAPFVNYQSDENFSVCSALGNNGKLTMQDKYVEPTEPTTEPICTTEPTEPTTEPICTTEPTEPTTEPICTTEPTEPTTEPICTTEPTEPTTEPICTTEPTEPTTEPICTTEPTEPTTEPICTTEPTKPTEPTTATVPTVTTEPVLPSNPIKPTNPSVPSTPDEPNKNGNSNNSGTSNNCGNTGTVKTVGAIQTGDDRNYYYLLASLIVSGLTLYGTVSYRKRKRTDK